nr:sodium-dependent transporter [Ignavibacteriaceae bacterium]
SGDLFNTTEHLNYWNEFSTSYQPLFFHFVAITLAGFVIFKGVIKGIERVTKILVPSLLIILLLLFFRAITLPNAFEGIKYLLRI